MTEPYRLAGREERPEDLVVSAGGLKFGGPDLIVIAGPCAVEGEETYLRTAAAVKAAGAHMLRGGVFKPRTSPYSFQGLGRAGLGILAAAKRETGLPVVTEILDPRDLDAVAEVHQLARQVPGVDALAAAARITPVDEEGHAVLARLGRSRRDV